MKNEFKKFLLRHKTYRRFVKNLKKRSPSYSSFEEYVDSTHAIFYISSAFKWNDDSYRYWSKLDRQWIEYYRKLEKKKSENI